MTDEERINFVDDLIHEGSRMQLYRSNVYDTNVLLSRVSVQEVEPR